MSSRGQIEALLGQFPGLLESEGEFRGETTLRLNDAQRIHEVCSHAKNALGFNFLVDLSSVDHYGDDPRFSLVYELFGIESGARVRLRAFVSEESPILPTVSSVWRTADWHEREVYDMMGIEFSGHPNLKRILMWEGFPHYPLRKDFPLEGKETDVPEVAFSKPAPMEGGPFVTSPTDATTVDREPRSRAPVEEDSDK